MRFEYEKCPDCGEEVFATLEKLQGQALVERDYVDGEWIYEGTTEIIWDTQKTIKDKDDRATLTCINGHEWKSKII